MERQPKRRRRPALSCIQCRRRKIKCDRTDPCKHCVAAKHHCTYDAYGARPLPGQQQRRERHIVQSQASNVPQPCSPDSLLPSLQSATTVPVTAAAGVSVSTSQVDTELEDIGDTDKVDDTRPPLTGRYNDPYLRELIERIESLEKASYQFSGQVDPGSANHILDANTGLQRSHIILNKTRILSSSHWKTTTKEVRQTVGHVIVVWCVADCSKARACP
jgi:hypothetical protein